LRIRKQGKELSGVSDQSSAVRVRTYPSRSQGSYPPILSTVVCVAPEGATRRKPQRRVATRPILPIPETLLRLVVRGGRGQTPPLPKAGGGKAPLDCAPLGVAPFDSLRSLRVCAPQKTPRKMSGAGGVSASLQLRCDRTGRVTSRTLWDAVFAVLGGGFWGQKWGRKNKQPQKPRKPQKP
jgi:hypothetical protein